MKKSLLFLCVMYASQSLANNRGACLPYSALYGDEAFYDLYNEPILQMTNTDLSKANLLGNINTEKEKIFYSGNDLFMYTPRSNGMKNGVQKIYYKSGVLLAKIPYRNDMLQGDVEVYYPSTNIKMHQSYDNNLPINTGKMYFENGNIALTQNYQNGQIDGIQTRYFHDGNQIESTISYSNGTLNGNSKIYYETNELLAEVNFQDDVIISNTCYDKYRNQASLNQMGLYKVKWGMRPIYCPTWTEFGDYDLTNGF